MNHVSDSIKGGTMKRCINRSCEYNKRAHCHGEPGGCALFIKPRRHFGSVYNPRSQEHSLDAILRREPGKWYSVWSLITLIPSAAVHSVVSNLRKQLKSGESIQNKQLWRPALERRESYYCLLLPGMERDE